MKKSLALILSIATIIGILFSCESDCQGPMPDPSPSDTTAVDTFFAPCLPVCQLSPCYDVGAPWFYAPDSCERLVRGLTNHNSVHFIDEPNQTMNGSINPNNPEEIVLDLRSSNPDLSGAVIFNMCTGENRKILDYISDARWSEDNWIYFLKGRFGGLWRMRPNGDSLVQIPLLTQTIVGGVRPRPKHPDELLYIQQDVGMVVARVDGTVLYQPGFRNGKWSADGQKIIIYKDNSIGFWDLEHEIFTPVIEQIQKGSYCAGPSPDEIIWKSSNSKFTPGIYLSNATLNTHRLILKEPSNPQYSDFILSPDGEMLIAPIRRLTHLPNALENNSFKSDRFISFLKIDSSCEIIGDFSN